MRNTILLAIIAALIFPLAGRGKTVSDALQSLQVLEAQYRNATTEAERTRLTHEMTEADSLWCEALTLEKYSTFDSSTASQTELLTMANALYNNAGTKGREEADTIFARLEEMNNPVALNYRGIRCSFTFDFSEGVDYFKASLLATTGPTGLYLPPIYNLAQNLLTLAAMAKVKGHEQQAGNLVDMASEYVVMYCTGVKLVTKPGGSNALPVYSAAEYCEDAFLGDGSDSLAKVKLVLSGYELELSYRGLCEMTGRTPLLK